MELDLNTIEVITNQAIELAFAILPKLILALLTYFAGSFIIKLLIKSLKRIFEKYAIETSLATFLSSFSKAFLYVMLFLAIAQTVGIEATSFLAVLGAAGLAIGLSLQGSLSNFAGGVLILIFRPFKVKDVVEAQGTIGEVESIDILYTKIRNFDNRVVTIPNGALANSNIVNLSQKTTRRVEMKLGVAYGTDLKKTRQVILDVLNNDVRVLPDPAPVVYFAAFGDSSLDLSVRCWTKTEDFWPVFWENMEAIKEAFEEKDIEVPFPQRDVHVYQHNTSGVQEKRFGESGIPTQKVNL